LGLSKFISAVVLAIIWVALIAAALNWGAPIALSIYATRKAPSVTRLTPEALEDLSISTAQGEELSYFGYQFEVPWNDIDETQTKLYPRDKPTRVVLTFRSGLRLMVTDIPAGQWVRALSSDFHFTPRQIEAAFGKEATQSDYSFDQMLYEFTPDKMDVWSLSSLVHNRDNMLLLIKSMALSRDANSGIFAIQNPAYKGFQQGTPKSPWDGFIFDLYPDTDRMEFILSQKNRPGPGRVSQAEINRIVQSLRRVAPAQPAPEATSARHN